MKSRHRFGLGLVVIALLTCCGQGLAQEPDQDIDPGDAPAFIPAQPTQTSVKSFTAGPNAPAVVIPSQDGQSLIVSMSTVSFRDYQAQTSGDLKDWSAFVRQETIQGNDSIRTFMVDLAMEMMVFARIAWF